MPKALLSNNPINDIGYMDYEFSRYLKIAAKSVWTLNNSRFSFSYNFSKEYLLVKL